MIYIVTYATHNERYFDILKKSCPDLIILGYGKPWNGFSDKVNATIEFCKSKNPDDIICFVDGFDSVVLSSKEEILTKYKEFNVPLVFSKECNDHNIIKKFHKDKIFGKCNNDRLNSGLFIGTAKSIIDFWKDIQYKEDDQIYATKKCNKINYMKIDDNNNLFYNYSLADKIHVEKEKLFINGNKTPCSIISCPGNVNINPILSNLNYDNLPEIKYDYKYRLSTYGKYYIPELIFLCLIIIIIMYGKNITLLFILIGLLYFLFLEYELFLKHIDVPIINKILYLLVDFMHMVVSFTLLYLFLNFECSIPKLLLLNIIFFTMIALFFYFKRCILTIISNKFINKENIPWTSPFNRIFYFFDLKKPYINKGADNTEAWMRGNMINISIIVLLNSYCLWKIYNGDNCVPKNGYGKIDFIKQLRNMFK